MKLFSWGANSYGQLSHGNQSEQCLFPNETKICGGFEDIVSIAAGGGHTIVQDSIGNVFGAGSNSHGQLADCTNNSAVLSKIKCLEEIRISDITCGWESSYFIVDTGSFLASGSNKYGQLGISKQKMTTTRHPIVLPTQNVTQVSAGLRHTALVTQAGHVYVCGQGRRGQLGILGEGLKVPTEDCDSWERVAALEGVVQVACGQHHTLALTSEGRVLGWGDNRRGQLGEGPSIIPTTQIITTADDADANHHCFVCLCVVAALEGVVQVACGQHHTLALTSEGRVLGWGDNRRGQLGEGPSIIPTPQIIATTDDADANIRAGWTHSALLSGGRVRIWGRNCYNQLGHSCDQDQVTDVNQLISLQGVKQLELGSEHNLALLENGEVWSWGWNEHGNCGTGTTDNVATPRQICLPSPVLRIAAGGGHSLALCAM